MKEIKVVYEISEEDIQTVAEEMFDKKLRKNDLKKVSGKIGDFLNWSDAIENAINFLNLDEKKYYERKD